MRQAHDFGVTCFFFGRRIMFQWLKPPPITASCVEDQSGSICAFFELFALDFTALNGTDGGAQRFFDLAPKKREYETRTATNL
jgi:hypothetical protein